MTLNDQFTRRTVLGSAAAAGLGLAVTGCSGSPSGGEDDEETPAEPVELGSASAVPVGGAKLYREQKIVVSQTSEGRFQAFRAVCTHQGCALDKVEKEEGNCPCHGSRFDVTTGEVLQGPATEPLPRIRVQEKSGKLVAGPDTAADAS